ncbi:putative E3 ubiquitin-protein ligase UBR7 [Ciona intestinalis]
MSEKRKADGLDNEESLSLQDIIAEDDELEETASAVLGGSDDKECTYTHGYVQRQAIYACSTCGTGDEEAGICLACSLECHNSHELYELYTKRNFRCDCGNSKYQGFKCNLVPDKAATNEQNVYGQNFKGLYCTCNRPYPDDEDDVDDEMIQCVVCEDWFHTRHLGETKFTPGLEYSEMVCFECTKRCTFLHKYNAIFAAPTKVEALNRTELDKSIDKEKKDTSNGNGESSKHEGKETDTQAKEKEENPDSNGAGENGDYKSEEIQRDTGENICKVKDIPAVKITGATFWPCDWRLVLCRCEDCKSLYDELKVAFLLDESDTVRAYEDKGKLNRNQTTGLEAVEGMSRVHQIEMIHGFNNMKDGLSDFLKSFADQGKVVTADDIKEFFQRLNQKRQRLDLPYNCR